MDDSSGEGTLGEPGEAAEWTEVDGTYAAYRWTLREHAGIRVLMVQLRGSVSRYDNEVATLCEALDRIPSATEPPLDAEVATLDVRHFANADGDECAHLTSVFAGLPCCWITELGAGQDERGRRWELPPLRWLAETEAAALDRVTALRRAGRFWETSQGLSIEGPEPSDALEVWAEAEWTERGFAYRNLRRAIDDCWFRNQLVDRQISASPPRRIWWPFPDASGETHKALRCGARLVYADDRLVEVDLRPVVTGRAPSEAWLDALADLEPFEMFEIDGVRVSDTELVELLTRWPSLRILDLGRDTTPGRAVLDQLLAGAGPALEQLRCGKGLDRRLRVQLQQQRPDLRLVLLD